MNTRKTPPFEPYPAWTQAKFWGYLRSVLRNASRYFPPKMDAKKLARRSCKKGRQRWEYQCAVCHKWFPEKEIELDHITPAGTLRDWNDLPDFCKRLFCGVDGYQVLCKPHHREKTNIEKLLKTTKN